MAYNTSKGPRGLGDIKNEDDPDTQIDFENDQISLTTSGSARLTVTNTHVSCSVNLSASAFYGDGSALQGITGSGGTMSSWTIAGDSGTSAVADGETATIAGTAPISTAESGRTVTVSLDNTSVSAGSYTYSSFTVDAQGRLTAASNGVAPSITAYNSAANNRVITSVDSTSVQGEAGLTYNGSFLAITGQASASLGVTGSSLNTLNTIIDQLHYSSSLPVSASAVYVQNDSYILGNLGIGIDSPVYDLHVNGAGVTVATIDGGLGSDSFLRFATAGTEKSFIKLGSGGNFIITQDATGGDLLLQAKPGGVNTTYLTLDGGRGTLTASVSLSSSADIDARYGTFTSMQLSGGLGTELLRLAKGESATREIVFENEGTDVASIFVNAAETLIIKNESNNDDIQFQTKPGGVATTAFTIDGATANVGVGTINPLVALDVRYNPTGSLSNDTGGGDVVLFGTGSLTTGKLYYLHTDGTWTETDADAPATGADQLLGIALGVNPASDGVLIRGFFDATTYLSNFTAGKAIYVSTTAASMDTTAPSAAGDFVRIVGYCTETPNVIYFNPSSEWIELA